MPKHLSVARLAVLVSMAAATLSLSACKLDFLTSSSSASSSRPYPDAVVATVNGRAILEQDVAGLVAGGMDKAAAVDRIINREIAATQARQAYGAEVRNAVAGVEREIAANVYAREERKKILASITAEELQHRYDTLVKDADFSGYKLVFALFASAEDAQKAVELAKAGNADALKAFQPVAGDKNGEAAFVSRKEVPYNLGVLVAKLKAGEFTTPALVRNGYIVLQAKEIKANEKPSLESVKESLRSAIADERLVQNLAEARKGATVILK